jgi:hypothetical protein
LKCGDFDSNVEVALSTNADPSQVILQKNSNLAWRVQFGGIVDNLDFNLDADFKVNGLVAQNRSFAFRKEVSREGLVYYQANVLPIFNRNCVSCHSADYQQNRNWLLNRANGASLLILKAKGMLNHAGGQRCSAAECNTFSNWLDIESK